MDSQTGLLYYNFRYYDPVSGRFTRTDTQETNAVGMDTYGYVHGNPETMCDPTEHWGWGATAIAIGVGALAVVGLGVTGAIAVPLVVAVAGGIATAFVVSAVIGYSTGAFNNENKFDDWGTRTIASEVIGGATSAIGFGLGNLAQGFAESTNGGMVGDGFQTTLNAAQKASANQAGQAIGNTAAGGIAVGINLQKIHHPNFGLGTKSHSTQHPHSTYNNQPHVPVYYSHIYTNTWQSTIYNSWSGSPSPTVSYQQYQAQANWDYVKAYNLYKGY